MVELFGGAIEASVPSTWRDVSQVRQVPGKYRHALMIISIVLSSLLILMMFSPFYIRQSRSLPRLHRGNGGCIGD